MHHGKNDPRHMYKSVRKGDSVICSPILQHRLRGIARSCKPHSWILPHNNEAHCEATRTDFGSSTSLCSTRSRKMATTGFVPKDVWNAYSQNVPAYLKVVDAFLAYVLSVGIIQFVYALAVGSFPFNSFLAGFLSTVGVFVLTVSLRMQLNEKNRQDENNRWGGITTKRAVADWLFCNLILHMAVLNFLG